MTRARPGIRAAQGVGPRRWLRGGLFALGALLLAGAATVGGLLWWSLPGERIDAQVPGLSAPVHVALDGDGIPHVEAADALDGAAALGFLHARDRMFQMELMRRAASGRLSERFGAATLAFDRAMRTYGLRHRAEADLARLDAYARATLDAYARGVNAWIARRGRFAAPELIAFGAPEPWTPVDSLLWGKTMALYLSGNWRRDLARADLLRRMPPERVRALWPAQDATPGPDARLLPASMPVAARLAALVPAFPAAFTQPSTASNEWAVDGAHSTTGKPLLAGDPHLAYSMPGIWYLARIQTPGGVLAGATAPGVPFLILGHNGRVAWSFTTTGADTEDVFVETPLAHDSYRTPDGPRPFGRREERIRVRGGPDDVLSVRETRHGPVLSDLDNPAGPVLAVAVASLADGDTAAAGLLALNRAGSVAEAGRAAALISAPVQNMLVADADGIGLFTTGRVPLRRGGDGTLPASGADGLHDWTGFASGIDLPHETDPASGRLVNANERVAVHEGEPGGAAFMGQDWFGDWRARRIRALLDTRATHSAASFDRMQTDVISAFAEAVLPRLLRTEPADADSRTALATLRQWDGTMRVDWPQPLLFNAWMRAFAAALIEREDVPAEVAGLAPDVVARALGPGGEAWCGGDCGPLLTAALSAAARGHGRDDRWGDAHQAEFRHPILGRLPLVSTLGTWRIAQPGDDTTVFRGAARGPGWTSVHGPSYRGVYDLADLDRSLFSLAPGQSGHPLRAQAGSLLGRWRDGIPVRLGAAVKPAETVDLRP